MQKGIKHLTKKKTTSKCKELKKKQKKTSKLKKKRLKNKFACEFVIPVTVRHPQPSLSRDS